MTTSRFLVDILVLSRGFPILTCSICWQISWVYISVQFYFLTQWRKKLQFLCPVSNMHVWVKQEASASFPLTAGAGLEHANEGAQSFLWSVEMERFFQRSVPTLESVSGGACLFTIFIWHLPFWGLVKCSDTILPPCNALLNQKLLFLPFEINQLNMAQTTSLKKKKTVIKKILLFFPAPFFSSFHCPAEVVVSHEPLFGWRGL